MTQYLTFCGKQLESIEPTYLEKTHGVKLNSLSEEKVPVVFPELYQSLCSCSGFATVQNDRKNFTITTEYPNCKCCICTHHLNGQCAGCEEADCPVIISKCQHCFHLHCIQRWLKNRDCCPLDNKEWDYSSDSAVIVCFDKEVARFDSTDTSITDIYEHFNLEQQKYKLIRNGQPVTECKPGFYALCTPDIHPSTSVIEVSMLAGETLKKVYIKYSATVSDLKKLAAGLFDIYQEQVKLSYRGIELVKDFDHLNLFKIGLGISSKAQNSSGPNDCQVHVDRCYDMTFSLAQEDTFVYMYVECGSSEANTLQDVISGRLAWDPYPYFKVTRFDLSCFLSSMYVLAKKSYPKGAECSISKFVQYAQLYKIPDIQISLAKSALELLLGFKFASFTDKHRMLLVVTFCQLISEMKKACGFTDSELLSEANLLCDLLLSNDKVQLVNWTFARKDLQKNKVFNIYSPLVLNKLCGSAPLLTLNEKLEIVVFVGKSKNVQTPTILFHPLKGEEVDVDAAQLGKTIGSRGETLLTDDRIFEEAIMVCMDTSNSMGQCSDFLEDLQNKSAEKEKEKTEYYKLWNEPKKGHPTSTEETRKLKNAIIWFITHPNFNDWQSKSVSSRMSSAYSPFYLDFRAPSSMRQKVLKGIICLEQKENPEIALYISRFRNVFEELLDDGDVTLDGYNYSVKRHKVLAKKHTSYNNVPEEYSCPISREIMTDPVITAAGFTFDRATIQQWFDRGNNTDPLTGAKLDNQHLIPNKSLKSMINEWKEEQEKAHTIKIKGLTEKSVQYSYTEDDANLYDVIYFIYHQHNLKSNAYQFRRGFSSLNPVIPLGNIDKVSVMILDNSKRYIDVSFKNSRETLHVPSSSNTRNLIYAYGQYEYDECSVWHGLKSTGDGISSGIYLRPDTRIYQFSCGEKLELSIFPERYVDQNSHSYLSRLNVVKKLFDAFVNRSIAYSFNTAIGLMSFNDSNELLCEISPYYEAFRDEIDQLRSNGGTALYASIKDAVRKLLAWRCADPEKRSKAKLRIICLSDGEDTTTNLSFLDKQDVTKHLQQNNIIFDSIFIGKEFDHYLPEISRKTGGYTFNPSSITGALSIMELETLIVSTERAPYYSATFSEEFLPPISKPKLLEKKTTGIQKALQKHKRTTLLEIMKQLKDVLASPHPEIDTYVNNNDISFWKVIFNGPEGTPYAGGCWLAYLQFPEDYPGSPPKIRFVTPIKHCNINSYGRVCHSILDRNYVPTVTVSLILKCIYGLLLNPDVADPLDTNLALSFYEASGEYEAQIMRYVSKHALKSREQWRKELS